MYTVQNLLQKVKPQRTSIGHGLALRPIAALALAGYFLMPAVFYLWMGVLVGGGMIVLGLYIRARW